MTGPSSTFGRAGRASLFVAGLGLRSAILIVGPLIERLSARHAIAYEQARAMNVPLIDS